MAPDEGTQSQAVSFPGSQTGTPASQDPSGGAPAPDVAELESELAAAIAADEAKAAEAAAIQLAAGTATTPADVPTRAGHNDQPGPDPTAQPEPVAEPVSSEPSVVLGISLPYATTAFDPSIEGCPKIQRAGTAVPASLEQAIRDAAARSGVILHSQ